jgi:hypothetical protein
LILGVLMVRRAEAGSRLRSFWLKDIKAIRAFDDLRNSWPRIVAKGAGERKKSGFIRPKEFIFPRGEPYVH